MKVYLQVNENNVITDAITYPYGDYVELEVNSLPVGVNGRWFKLENGIIVEYPELKPINPQDEIQILKAQVIQLEAENANINYALMMGGLI